MHDQWWPLQCAESSSGLSQLPPGPVRQASSVGSKMDTMAHSCGVWLMANKAVLPCPGR